MRTKDAIKEWGGSVTALAAAMTAAGYPITRQAISQWGETVPELRAYQLREMMAARASRRRASRRLQGAM